MRRRIGGRHVRGAYAPLELLTGWLHTVARYNPVTQVVEATRGMRRTAV